MDAPYCKICDHHHYGVAHVWAKTKPAATQETSRGSALIIRDSGVVGEPAPVAAPKPKFDRVAYQREYMKKWRAAKK